MSVLSQDECCHAFSLASHLELEPELKLESELEKEIENKEGPLGLTAFCPAVEEIENEEGLLGLTLLCPAVEEELSGEDGIMTRVLSSADETPMVRRRTIGASILGLSELLLPALSWSIQHQQILLSKHWILSSS